VSREAAFSRKRIAKVPGVRKRTVREFRGIGRNQEKEKKAHRRLSREGAWTQTFNGLRQVKGQDWPQGERKGHSPKKVLRGISAEENWNKVGAGTGRASRW